MITDEMIEKAADAIRGDLPRASEWSNVARELARAALEAAYPQIAAKVLEEAANTASTRASCRGAVAAIRALKAKYKVSK